MQKTKAMQKSARRQKPRPHPMKRRKERRRMLFRPRKERRRMHLRLQRITLGHGDLLGRTH